MPLRLALPSALVAALAALTLLGPAGCDGATDGTDAGTGGLVGRSCAVEAECGALRCDPIRRQCICLSDDDCADNRSMGEPTPFCNNFTGLCVARVAGCTSDSECSAASYCNRQTRSCRVRKSFCEPCADSRECGAAGDECVEDPSLSESFCGSFCQGDGDCPTGATCRDVGGTTQCWPKAGKNCRLFTGCTPDSRKACARSEDCADLPDQVCDPGSGVCVARVSVCPFGQVCDSRSRVCVDACNSDADCTAIDPKLRCIGRACQPVGECVSTSGDPGGDTGCPANKVCSIAPRQATGTCVPFCASSNDCAPGDICQRTPDNRSKCLAGCNANADCPLDQRCTKLGSASSGQCEGAAGTTCQADSVCSVCSFCDLTANQCQAGKAANYRYCKPCGADLDCGQGHCLDLADGRRCGQPCPDTGCPRGFFCAEICLGAYQGATCNGTLVAECIPTDESCSATGANKCGF